MITTEKMLPHSIEAEQGVLGSILIDPDVLASVADFLHPEDFYRDAHRTIYRAILTLSEHRDVPDFITLCDALEREEKLGEVGGASYITSLIDHVPTSGNIRYYGEIVVEKSDFRALIHGCSQGAAMGFAQEDGAVEQTERLISAIHQRRLRGQMAAPLSAIVQDYLTTLDTLREHKGQPIGIPTGFRDLDRLLSGLQKSDLITLAARPAMGKTSFALALAAHAARNGHPVGFFSLEMGKEQLMARLLSMQAHVGLQELRTGTWADEDWDRMTHSLGVLTEWPLYIDDTGALSPLDLRSRAKRLHAEHGIELLIVDYIGLLRPTLNGKRFENKVHEVSEITASLKALAKELNIPVLALCQLNRSVEQRQNKRPLLSDLRDSGSVEQDSDVVLFIYRDDVYKDADIEPDNLAEIIVAKHRNGPEGVIDLHWNGAYTQFGNVETREYDG